MIIGIDHGYYAIKSRNFSFPAGVTAYTHEPYTLKNTLQIGGKYFVCGTGRQPNVKAVCRIEIIVGGNQSNVELVKCTFQQSYFKHVTSDTALVFDNVRGDAPRSNLVEQSVQPRSFEQCSADPVIHKMTNVRKAILFCVCFEDFFLESGLSRGDYPNYIFFECVNYPLSICSDGRQ